MSSIPKGPGEGYLDQLLSVFDSHHHPLITVGHLALRWMACRTPITDELDILVRNSEQADLIHHLVSTGSWNIATGEKDLEPRVWILPTKGSIRILNKVDDGYPKTIRLWPEDVYHITVDGETIEVPDCTTWNSLLVETKYHPDLKHMRYGPNTLRSYSADNTRVIPPSSWLARSPGKETPIFIPSLPRMLEGLLQQSISNKLPSPRTEASYQIDLMIRYLFLERPNQCGPLMTLLSSSGKTLFVEATSTYKRKLPTRIDFAAKRIVEFEPWNLPINSPETE